MFKKIFRGSESKSKENNQIMDIGVPTNVVRGIHVSKNNETGDLEGLPKQWHKMLQTMITEHERTENPDAGKSIKITFFFFHLRLDDS
jgi:p21-activated kinase 1